MKRIQAEWILFAGSVLAFFGVSVSIALMFLEGYVAAVLFWICLITGIILQTALSKRCHRLQTELENVPKHRIGLLSFGKNLYGLTADLIMVVSLIAFIVAYIVNGGLIIQLALLGALVFGISMHCICNGNNLDVLLCYVYKTRRYRASRGKTQGGMKHE